MTLATLPDIATQTHQRNQPLDWVGMQGIALPVRFADTRLSASASAGVNLDDGQSRGIHMSRLYLALACLEQQELNPQALRRLLAQFLDSHEGLSSAASVRIDFELLLKRPALVSPLSGWKSYPVTVEARIKNEMFHVELFVRIPYSSTCPCSAALARQLIQAQFQADFEGADVDRDSVLAWLGSSQGIVATPHSQRSEAQIKVRLLDGGSELPVIDLIERVEAALGTAVQTAVKRADEQAFALANGQNLMFCEDAARRVDEALRKAAWASGFTLRVEHAESLHAHDAVAVSQWRW
ncbi:GTP cyclohydrolase FolE2 [Pseudomonas reidholzensis]|uniref:GTP cyclohydrolase FolE2 n=1 Tax=Pseudomonas reidholzensis TaxID=1785162 RepID=A0A383RMF7_9PSED|nr:GTP cyclohydrolase FolE2 [Pseudomonas reidholzensis]SYX87933.1 GTP cyclohydrolase FolE2 [Pseudomonas reidholzensis]